MGSASRHDARRIATVHVSRPDEGRRVTGACPGASIHVLAALVTFAQGKGSPGHQSWGPVTCIVGALEDAFYHSFDNVKPSNKRLPLGLDVSGSMCLRQVAGIPGPTPRLAAAQQIERGLAPSMCSGWSAPGGIAGVI